VRPSIVVFGDGVRYNLTDLDDASYHEMVSFPPLGEFMRSILTRDFLVSKCLCH
jgi:hypothetical protein